MRYFRIIIILMAIGVTLLRAFFFITKSDIDVAPVIECDKDVLRIKCSDSDEKLLESVKAYDEQDGDLTDKIFIERLYYLVGDKKSKIKFVVIDSDNNVTKLSRDVIYTDYESPKINVSSDLIFVKEKEKKIITYFTAEDIFDGDITNRIRLISNNYNANTPGNYNVLARVSNSHGDLREFKFKIYVLEEEMPIQIKLKEHIKYIHIGQELDYSEFIDEASPERQRIEIDSSKLDITKEGGYEVYYKIKDGEKTVGFNRLIVVVGE